MSFAARTAIVTGSDSGIGQATAVALAQIGMDVGVTWHSDSAGADDTAEQVRSEGRRAVVSQLDTTDLENCGDVIESMADELGGLDVFVNNAGSNDSASFLDMSLKQWRTTVATDLDGAFVCIQRAAQRMVTAGNGGRIIAVTSVHEHQPRVGFSAYDAAKHGLGGLIKTIAIELGHHNITANAIAPGEIFVGKKQQDPENSHRPGIPLGRSGDAREVAEVIAFLASGASSYVTGASWTVDGGMLQMGPPGGSHLQTDDWR